MDRRKIAVDWAESSRPLRILDIGCGEGLACGQLLKLHPGWQIMGIDAVESEVEKAKGLTPNAVFVHAPFPGLPEDFPLPEGGFDCVMLTEVIEHLPNPGIALEEIHSLLCPGGTVIISTPNAISLMNQARHYFQRIGKRIKRINAEPIDIITQNGHLTSFDVFTLARLLKYCGFKVEKYQFSSWTTKLYPPFQDTIIIKARRVGMDEVEVEETQM